MFTLVLWTLWYCYAAALSIMQLEKIFKRGCWRLDGGWGSVKGACMSRWLFGLMKFLLFCVLIHYPQVPVVDLLVRVQVNLLEKCLFLKSTARSPSNLANRI